jgi:predicted transcriptional regulator of viral defense system
MSYRDNQQALRALYAVATTQGGYFTAKQAGAAGYGIRHLDYHAKTGNFERVGHGLYRLPTIPLSEHDDLIPLSLWSRDRSDRPQAVASHITALGLHHLSDVLPTRIHLTAPRSFRKAVPTGAVLHKASLERQDMQEWTGFRVTSPQRTLLDVATDHSISEEQLDRAVNEAMERGLVQRSWRLGAPQHLWHAEPKSRTRLPRS